MWYHLPRRMKVRNSQKNFLSLSLSSFDWCRLPCSLSLHGNSCRRRNDWNAIHLILTVAPFLLFALCICQLLIVKNTMPLKCLQLFHKLCVIQLYAPDKTWPCVSTKYEGQREREKEKKRRRKLFLLLLFLFFVFMLFFLSFFSSSHPCLLFSIDFSWPKISYNIECSIYFLLAVWCISLFTLLTLSRMSLS